MRTNGQTIRGNEMVIPHVDLESVKEWAKRSFTRERIVGIAVSGSTLTVLGVVFFALYGAMEANTIVAPSPYLASLDWQLSIPGY